MLPLAVVGEGWGDGCSGGGGSGVGGRVGGGVGGGVGSGGVHRLLQTHQFPQGNFQITLIMVEKLPNLLRRVFAPDAT